MVKVTCPICEEEIELGEKPEVGSIVECPTCGTKLMIRHRGRRWTVEVMEEEY